MVTDRTAPPWVSGYGRHVGPPAREADPQRRPRPRGPHRGIPGFPGPRPTGGRLGQELLEAGHDRLPGELGLDPAPAGRPHGPGPVRVGQQPGHGGGDRPGPAPVDHRPGLALHDRLGGAARAPGHHRQPGGGRLQEHHPEGLQVQPQPAGPARHGEHVAGGVVGRQLLPGHLAGQVDAAGHRAGRGQAAQPPRVRPAPDQQQPRLRNLGHHLRPGLDQAGPGPCGAPAGRCNAHRVGPEAVALAHRPPVHRRVVGAGVDPGREQLDRAAAAHRPPHPGRRPVADGGEQAR